MRSPLANPQEAGVWVRGAWKACRRLPFGRWAFSRFLGVMVPYTGSMRPRVVALEPGCALVELDDRRTVRNHLGSIHAVAIANLVELTGNLALAGGLGAGQRFIVKSMNIQYIKKARGTLRAQCECPIPGSALPQEVEIAVTVADSSGSPIATGTLLTRVGGVSS